MRTIPPPSENATVTEINKYLHAMHECIETHHEENVREFSDAASSREHIGRGLKFDRRINIVSLIVLIFMIIGFFAASVRWTSTVDGRLDGLTAAGARRDSRLDSIDTNVRSLQDLALSNHETIVGADRAARGKP